MCSMYDGAEARMDAEFDRVFGDAMYKNRTKARPPKKLPPGEFGHYRWGQPRTRDIVQSPFGWYTWRPTESWARNTVNYLNRNAEYVPEFGEWKMEPDDVGF